MRIAVVGGTGTVGRHVVRALDRAGIEPVVIARSRGIDIVNGAGLADAFEGVDTVVDVNNITTFRRSTAVRHFRAAGQQMAKAERRFGTHRFGHRLTQVAKARAPHLGSVTIPPGLVK